MSVKKQKIDSASTVGGKGVNQLTLPIERRNLIRRLVLLEGQSIRKVARDYGLSRNTVRDCVRGTVHQPPAKRTEAGTFLQANRQALLELYLKCEFHCPPMAREIKKIYGIEVPLRMLQRFCKPFKQELNLKALAADVPIRFETQPGDQMQIDFGERDVLLNGQTYRIHVFVAVLGYSRKIFTKAYSSETQGAWIDGVESALLYFGGIPRRIICDNAKSMVRDHYAPHQV